MLAIPTRGVARSINVHNVELDVLCDWIEGSLLFRDAPEVSASDVVDALCDGEIYDNQEFAWEIVADAWNELRRREGWIGNGCPVEVIEGRVRRRYEWRNTPAHSFCIALAFATWYPAWARTFGRNFTEQGEMFELVTKECLQWIFSGWEIHATGWTRTHVPQLNGVVLDVASRLGERSGDVSRWTKPQAHEAGLDLLCYRPFPDRRVGVPVYLLQCASGGDWEGKLHIPNLLIWTRIVEFTSAPKKAFATPFALRHDEFIRNCNLVDGMLLDRCRLLSPARDDPDWVSPDLKNRLVAWLEPRVERLPTLDE